MLTRKARSGTGPLRAAFALRAPTDEPEDAMPDPTDRPAGAPRSDPYGASGSRRLGRTGRVGLVAVAVLAAALVAGLLRTGGEPDPVQLPGTVTGTLEPE